MINLRHLKPFKANPDPNLKRKRKRKPKPNPNPNPGRTFATKFGNFTNIKMLFLAAVKDFVFFAKMKIQFKRGIVH